MYKLYARNGAGSMAVEAALAFGGFPYEVEVVDRQADGSFPDSFHRINPRAEVPTLILPDHSVMTESAAMLIYLAEVAPGANLGPAPSAPNRAKFLRWVLFVATTVYMSDLRLFYPERYTTDAAGCDGIKAKALDGMNAELGILADALGQGPFMLGEKMSALDIYAAMLTSWVPDMGELFRNHANLKTLYNRVVAVPAVAKVWARNGM
ncbi:MAG: glutathione S-transferase family protein [Alphaproteobacteria bacterium]|nr:glutathione S-transferase family protein [Alphaproteobacteria bacterium]